MIWEGLFFLFWHADKMVYQRDTAIRVSNLMKLIPDTEDANEIKGGSRLEFPQKKKQWFESMLYIFNKHWERVDNFRIDKFLMLVRWNFNALFSELKSCDYPKSDIEWL